MVEDNLWCMAYELPHSPIQCAIAHKLQEEEDEYNDYGGDHNINMLSFQEYDSFEDEGEYDLDSQRSNQQCYMQ